MHRLGKIYDKDIGFYTICHGDFHLKNIIMCQDRFIFIDVTYLCRNWNYSDLDYVDFFGFYDKKEYPWMIDSQTCLSSYHEGVEIKLGKKYEENIKNMITKYSLEKSISNGKRNNLDISNEEKWLKIVKRKMANCT